MEFSEVFKEILIEHDIGVKELSKRTGIDDSVLYDYFHGALPNIEHAVVIANEINCSVNYLIGLDDTPNKTKFKSSYDISLFSSRYDKLLQENRVTHFRLSKEFGLNYSSHYACQRGSVPKMCSLIIIAKYFSVSIDYLIGRSDDY